MLRSLLLLIFAVPAVSADALRVVSLNLAQADDAAQIVREWSSHPSLNRADVYLLQEVTHRPGGSVAHDLAHRLGYHVYSEPTKRDGLAILSRYPVRETEKICLKLCDLRFRTRERIALGATVDTPGGPVRVFNVHLDTRINSAERLQQLQPVLDAARKWSGAVVWGGDLNTNHMLWVGNVLPVPFAQPQAVPVIAAAEKQGFRTAFARTGPTFDHLAMQLDWIFQRGFEARDPRVERLDFSDHHALAVTLTRVSAPNLRAASLLGSSPHRATSRPDRSAIAR